MHMFLRKEPIFKNATINFIIDVRREDRDNTYPLEFSIYTSDKTRDLPTSLCR
jgi:hypothetical protein